MAHDKDDLDSNQSSIFLITYSHPKTDNYFYELKLFRASVLPRVCKWSIKEFTFYLVKSRLVEEAEVKQTKRG